MGSAGTATKRRNCHLSAIAGDAIDNNGRGKEEVKGNTNHLNSTMEKSSVAPCLSRKRPWVGGLRRTFPGPLLVAIIATCIGTSSSSFHHATAFNVAQDVQRTTGDNSADTAQPGMDDPAAVRWLLDGDEGGVIVPCDDVGRNRDDLCHQDRMLKADVGLEVGEPNGFLELAQERFVARERRAPTSADKHWTFSHLQVREWLGWFIFYFLIMFICTSFSYLRKFYLGTSSRYWGWTTLFSNSI